MKTQLNACGCDLQCTDLPMQKVLYLAIVNMPSEDEMSRAREALGQTV
jgi:hypothetical protein